MPILHFIIRWFFAPIFFIGFLWLGLNIFSTTGNKLLLPPLLLAAIAVSFIVERILPYEPAWNHPKNDRMRDVLHAIINEMSVIASVALLPTLAAFMPHLNLWLEDWPLWLQLAIAILVADFGITIVHYVSHKSALLWRLHAVHHSVKRMYGFNGLMKHPLHQAVELLAGTAPLFFIGMPESVAALLAYAVAIQLLMQHSNADYRIGPLVYLWAAAPGHRHHHLASKTEGDVNFGLFTMIWDHMLGVFITSRPQPRDGDIGVAGRQDYPDGYFMQLIEPFRPGKP